MPFESLVDMLSTEANLGSTALHDPGCRRQKYHNQRLLGKIVTLCWRSRCDDERILKLFSKCRSNARWTCFPRELILAKQHCTIQTADARNTTTSGYCAKLWFDVGARVVALSVF